MANTDTIATIAAEMAAKETEYTNAQTALESSLTTARADLEAAEAALDAADPTAADFGDKVEAVNTDRAKVELLAQRVEDHKTQPVFTAAEFDAYLARIYAVVQDADDTAKAAAKTSMAAVVSAITPAATTDTEARALFETHRAHAAGGTSAWIYAGRCTCADLAQTAENLAAELE